MTITEQQTTTLQTDQCYFTMSTQGKFKLLHQRTAQYLTACIIV